MPKCRPSKWVLPAILGAGLPFLGAWWLTSGSLHNDIATRAKSALDAAETTKWATVTSDGRDVTISGESPTQAAIDDAVKAVAGTYGVRTVNAADVKLAALPAPTIESITTANTTPEIKGTWAEGLATTLAVTVAGTAYKLGESPELTSSGGNWLLKLTQPLKEGSFDATVEQSDGATRTAAAATPAKVIIDTTPPALPVPEIPQAAWPYAITGTWGEEPGAALQADVNGKTYVLGQAPALTSDGKGTYTFAPTDEFQPGSYDLKMTSTDPLGNVATTVIPAAIVVPAMDAAPQPAPAPVPDVPVTVMANAPAADAVWPYALTGTWSEAPGNKLRARLAGRTYELGRGSALTSDGKGAFTFAPAAKTLKPGTYTVWFTAENSKGTKAVTSANVVIPEPPAAPEPAPAPAPEPKPDWAAPTVEKQLSLSGAPIVKGTWAQGPATSLKVTVAGRTYELGKDANLSSKDGNWSLMPGSALKDGIYDVVADAADAEGVTKRDATVAELEVDGDPPAAPAVTAYSGEASPPAVAGTWDEKQAVGGLAVTMPDINYTAILGAAGSPLTSDGGGNWSLALNRQLAPGTYEVQVTSTDAHGRQQVDTTTGEVVITPPPAPPPTPIMIDANDLAAGVTYPTVITGKWSEGTAVSLMAQFAGRTYELGKGAALTSDGQGNFSFAPAAKLEPGTYTAVFTSKGPAGEMVEDKVDVTVAAPPPPPVVEPEPAPAPEPAPVVVVPERPFDCVMTLGRLNQVFPIRFEFDRSELQGVSALALAQYAALLKDPRCAELKVEIGGHADFRGSEAYNQGLSERRAKVVLGALTEAGIDTTRMTPKGYSELVPLDPATTDEARTKNRRVEITLNKN